MRQHVAKLAPAFLVGGCSLLYNPNNIDKPPGDADVPVIDADADIDAPPLADADPSMLMVLDVMPKVIYEGQGQFNSRPAIVVIRGHHFVSDGLTVDISPSDGLTVSEPTVSRNGDYIALTVSVAIDDMVDSGTTPLTVTVNQNGGPVGGVTLADAFSVEHLPQLTASGTIGTGTLAELYSEVNTGDVTFTGSEAAIVRSVSRIKIGNISANGAAGTTNSAGAAGPGGCAGGGPASNAPCLKTVGGGGGSGGNGGGGGGGFSTAGDPGVNGGPGGDMHGEPQVVSLAANAGAGGGGGGKGALSNSGGGGGSGGTVVIVAGGDLEVGTIDVKGGDGGKGSSLLMLGASGGGGGGSGGLVVLSSEAGAVTAGTITATAGGGGAAGGAGAGAGGAGSAGRVRVDTGGASLPSSNPELHRGPVFVDIPPIVTNKALMVTMAGSDGDVVDAYVIPDDNMVHTGEPMDLTFSNGMLMFEGVLLPGYNQFCVTLEPGTRGHADKLADKCIAVAYLP